MFARKTGLLREEIWAREIFVHLPSKNMQGQIYISWQWCFLNRSTGAVEDPIVKALCMLDASCEGKLRKKIEIAYFLFNLENLPFCKMDIFCQMEERHGVEQRRNRHTCTVFVEYIAKDLRERLAGVLDRCQFFTIQTDGSTDSPNMEEQLILAFYFNSMLKMEKCVCVQSCYL